MAGPLLAPLIAAGTSFLMAKASGASNKTALMSGILGGIGAYGVGQLGSGLTAASQAGTVPMSTTIGGAPMTTMVPATQTAGQKLAGSLGSALSTDTAKIGIGSTIGSLPATSMAARRAETRMNEMMRPFGGEEAYEQAYQQAQGDLSGITDKAQYTDQGGLSSSVYNFGSPMFTAKTGGIAEIAKYREGGVNYLPSKTDHDEKDYGNYVRAEGYVEDGSGNGDKDEDTMLAQLADGEFVSRADAVLGAGIMSGANPKDFKEMRRMGSKFFYNQQDQLKRIYDMVS